ncbi:winged helix-turn-helix transcriptional regulator [Nocardia rhizosphaerihabitans]|uniref:winged helix-turn-helix transcriptional regulator n=1 Tax=Nocardia rhizosphaerihabitans TaxID=1691570 RepID=UPI00366F3B3E
MLGLHRFDEFQHSLGIARNVLTDWLKRLVEAGVLERIAYQQHPASLRVPTHRSRPRALHTGGRAHALGHRHMAGPNGLPRLTRHRTCGGQLHSELVCEECGAIVDGSDLELPPGPAYEPTPTPPQVS